MRITRFLLIFMLISALFLATPEAEAARKRRSSAGIRLRISGAYGGIFDYTSLSYATNAKTQFIQSQPGARAQIEIWTRSRVGFLLESETWYMNVSGRSVYYGSGTAAVGVHIAGKGGPMASELVLWSGPSIQYWPDIRSYVGGTSFNPVSPRVLAISGGIRWRVPVASNWVFEFGGGYHYPLKPLGIGGVSVVPVETRTLGGTFLADFQVSKRMSIGFGGLYQLGRLSYIPNGNSPKQPQQVDINILSPLLNFRLWF